MISISYRKKKENEDLSGLAWTLLEEESARRGIRDVRARVVYGPHGKPYLTGNPFYFNLSHSGEYALCAVCDREVGCDIQVIGSVREALLRRRLHSKERDYILSGADEREQAERFTRIWTLRECYVKQTGIGLSLDFETFHFRIGEKGPVLCLTPGGEVESLIFEEQRVEDHLISFCYPKD